MDQFPHCLAYSEHTGTKGLKIQGGRGEVTGRMEGEGGGVVESVLREAKCTAVV